MADVSETRTASLTDFLLQRIAEDEAVALAAVESPWRVGGGRILADGGVPTIVADYDQPADARHIARHDPARVLAECEAKRRIVEAHPADLALDYCATCFGGDFDRLDAPTHEPWPCPTLRALAAMYADHPDYRAEWAL